MDAREKAIEAVEDLLNTKVDRRILDLPELEAYFREKFENEPGRLVVEKECPICEKGVIYEGHLEDGYKCVNCAGTGTIKRRMTRREIESIIPDGFILPSGEVVKRKDVK